MKIPEWFTPFRTIRSVGIGLLKWVARIFRTIALTVGTLIVLFTGMHLYSMDRQADAGKAWCESVILEYETDREKFLEEHSDKSYHGVLLLPSLPEHKPAQGRFIAESTGEYICNYNHGGFMFPHSYEYSSKTREWANLG